jgi:hypothetical protein
VVSIEKVRKSPALSLKRIEIWGLKVPRELRCLSASTPRSISFLEITPILEEITLKIFKLRESDSAILRYYILERTQQLIVDARKWIVRIFKT